LNPAVAIGFDTAHSIFTDAKFLNSVFYTLMECSGAALAAGTFYLAHNEDYILLEQEKNG